MWASISFSHRHTVEANGLILHYVISLCIDFASGKVSVGSYMTDESSDFQFA